MTMLIDENHTFAQHAGNVSQENKLQSLNKTHIGPHALSQESLFVILDHVIFSLQNKKNLLEMTATVINVHMNIRIL